MSTSSDGAEPYKPFPSRSVSLLSLEQLKRKRESDRESQRQTRGRVKETIRILESKVQRLTRELDAAKLENAALQSKSETNQSWQQPQTNASTRDSGDQFLGRTKPAMDVVLRGHPQSSRCPGLAIHPSSDHFILESEISSEPAGQDLLDPSLISHRDFPFNDLPQTSLCVQVWEARPIHLPPTCRLDKILIEIIDQRILFDPLGGNVIEFSNPRFPSVAALLNPETLASTLPLTTAIVTHVIYGLTVSTLPEQIAIMYVMCTILRWQITGSKQDYDAMPEWLRPGAAQLVTGHPAWVDTFPWPKAREAICQNFEYHNNWEYFKSLTNKTISINWPYDPSDSLIAISDTEYIINPVFMTHIRTLENWTLGSVFVEAFPDLAKHVKVGPVRGENHFRN